MTINWFVVIGAGIVPLLLGFLWYHPKVFGTAWMELAGINMDKAKEAKMTIMFASTLILGILISMSMLSMTIHQMHMMSTLLNTPGFGTEGSEVNNYYMDFLTKYGKEFRTFKHGAFHGLIGGIFIVLPIVAVNALFEQKKLKYILINAGYWTVSMIIMGGIVCAWA